MGGSKGASAAPGDMSLWAVIQLEEPAPAMREAVPIHVKRLLSTWMPCMHETWPTAWRLLRCVGFCL